MRKLIAWAFMYSLDGLLAMFWGSNGSSLKARARARH
jgi:hypothetical protein